jgi:hypothetical protein
VDLTDAIRDAFQQLVSRAHQDERFKCRLLADPIAAAEEAGIEVPYEFKVSTTIRVVQDTAAVKHLVLPARPSAMPVALVTTAEEDS